MARIENLFLWARRLEGARAMVYHLNEFYKLDLVPGISKKEGKKVYHEAVVKLLMDDIRHVEHFINGEPYFFTDHEYDNKGKLISVKVTTKEPKKLYRRK